jgi:hypothetical protein
MTNVFKTICLINAFLVSRVDVLTLSLFKRIIETIFQTGIAGAKLRTAFFNKVSSFNTIAEYAIIGSPINAVFPLKAICTYALTSSAKTAKYLTNKYAKIIVRIITKIKIKVILKVSSKEYEEELILTNRNEGSPT